MRDDSLENCYRLLEVRPGASHAEIRDAYRVLSRVWHPDRFAGSPEMQARATARQQELNDAYRRLLRAPQAHNAGGTAAGANGAQSPPRSRSRSAEAAAPTPSNVAAAGDVAAAGSPAARRRTDRLQRRVFIAAGCALLAGVTALLTLGFLARDGVVRDAAGAAVRGTAVSAGGAQACAAGGKEAWCWTLATIDPATGGELGAGARPLQLAGHITALASGLLHSCALLEDASAWCWGSNILGQLGTRGLRDQRAPARIALDVRFASLSTLGRHTCGITLEQTLYCWGDDADGQLGIGTPVAACRLDDVRIYCSDRPEQVGRAGGWRAVAAGGSHTCAIDVDDALHCWGSNRFGQLGRDAGETCAGPGGAVPCRRRPGRVPLDRPVAAVATGASHTCALDDQGRVLCWGLNAQWQTGTDTARIVAAPAPVASGIRFSRLIAGAYHTCGLTPASALHCWGSDARGELRGRAADRCDGAPCAARPLALATGVLDVGAGFGVTCSRRRDGIIRCWGESGGQGEIARTPGSAGRRVRAVGIRLPLDAVRTLIYTRVVQPIEQAI